MNRAVNGINVVLLGLIISSCSSSDGRQTVVPNTTLSVVEEDSPSQSVSTLTRPLTITGISLIDARMNQPVAQFDPLQTGSTLYLDQLPEQLNLVAHSSEDTESVVFDLNESVQFRTENVAPYALYGDNGGNFLPWKPRPGSYEVTATAFDEDGGRGYPGESLSIQFQVEATAGATSMPLITGFGLVDATTNQPIPQFDPLQDNSVLDLDQLPEQLNLVAYASQDTESVIFDLNENGPFRTENVVPYTLYGDNEGNFLPWKPEPGSYEVTATAFGQDGGEGDPGGSQKIQFHIEATDSDEPESANIPPVIFGDSFTVTTGQGSVLLDVLANDQDPDNGPESLTITGLGDRFGSTNGTVAIEDNKVRYTPPPGWVDGFDVFSYDVTDGDFVATEIVVFVYLVSPEIQVSLVNADTNQRIPELESLEQGQTLNRDELPQNLSLMAEPQVSGVGSVVFFTPSMSTFQTENVPPYAVAGDQNGDFSPWQELDTDGIKRLSVQAYSDKNGQGQLMAETELSFHVISTGDN